MQDRKEPQLPDVSGVCFCPTQLARKLCGSLAKRWNVGTSTFNRNGMPSTAFACGAAPAISQTADDIAPPAGRICASIDASLFDDIPAFVPLGEWTPETILEFLPDGAPGLDGHVYEWLHTLSVDSLARLVQLLNLADAGSLPAF